MESCQNVVNKEPLEYCGNKPAEEYELDVDSATGSAYFCDECEPPENDKA